MMDTEELTAYIKNYLENDKTRSAIMLTGPWGCGKSYYIQNMLTPALIKDGVNRCIVVSLYGLKNLEALSKSIYLEVRAKALFQKSETVSAAKIFGKTIIKGVASFFGVDINVSEDDLNKLYHSIDLTDKLIVLEDLERSGIDIIEIMGYVNNLVEQDGVKVLLVANEGEIIKHKEDNVEERGPIAQSVKSFVNKDKKPILTEKTKEYIRIKEKTVFDTIKFKAENNDAVRGIISGFESKYFKQLLDKNTRNEKKNICDIVVDIMDLLEIYNLRAITFACQKTEDMFKGINDEFNIEYFESIFCSIIAYALRLSVNSSLIWENDATSPFNLGIPAFPLYKFAYNFIKNHFFYKQGVVKAQQAFIEQRKLEIKQEETKNAVNTLYYAFKKTESEVTEAVKTMCNYLDDINVIPIMQYGELGNYLIAVRKIVSDTKLVDLCISKLLKNIQSANLSENEKIALEMHNGIELELPEEKEEYERFNKKIVECVNRQSSYALSNIHDASGVKSLIDAISANQGRFLTNRSLMNGINIEELLRVLPECTAALISELRSAIISVYRASNIAEYLSGDISALNELLNGLQKIIDNNIVTDKVMLQQFKWFVTNVADIIYRLKKG